MVDVRIEDVPEKNRFEAHVDGELAGVLDYRHDGGSTALVHTEVFPAYGGRGLGGVLAQAALDGVRADGRRAVPVCSFIAQWVEMNPEYADVVETRN